MNFKEITDLIKLVNRTELSEFKMKDKDFEISIRTSKFQGKNTHVVQAGAPPMIQMPAAQPVAAPQAEAAPAAKPAAAPAAEPKAEAKKNLLEIKSPIVGTFYRSSSPDKPPFVKVGDSINVGDTVCIVEAMKLFNDIESEVAGTIVEVVVDDASPVEYDQVLFLVDPS